MTEKILAQEWTARPERGALPLIKRGAKIALWLGRPGARLFLYPVCLYFFLSSPKAARDSRAFLNRALGRPARIADIFRHFLTFASCLLDRVFLLNERIDGFQIRVHGETIVRDIQQSGGGCLLFGAHFGSFEAARAAGRAQGDIPVSLLMYEENAKKIRAALAAINPRLETEVIGLGRLDSLIAVADRLRRGHFVGVLADRNVDGKNLVRHSFLGAPAAFSRGPFQVAMLLRRPVVLMIGLYRGGGRYDVIFEPLAEPFEPGAGGEGWLDNAMQRYVERLEYYCREAPYNWANFYDFWA